MEYIGERVSVMAAFGEETRFRPVKFKWANRVIVVKTITYSWTNRVGQSKIYHFSVTDGKTLYELSFNTGSLLWVLERVETDFQGDMC